MFRVYYKDRNCVQRAPISGLNFKDNKVKIAPVQCSGVIAEGQRNHIVPLPPWYDNRYSECFLTKKKCTTSHIQR